MTCLWQPGASRTVKSAEKSIRTHTHTHSWQHLHGPQLVRQALWDGWATNEALLHLVSSDAASTARGSHRGDCDTIRFATHERELGDVYACVRIFDSAVEQGCFTTRVRQFVFMFHKPWVYPLLAAAGLRVSVHSLENLLALQSVLRLFERQCGYTWSAHLVANETELAEELAWAMNRPDVMKRICMP